MRRLAVLAAMLLLLPCYARAQNGSWQMPLFQGESFRPEFSSRDLRVMTRVLQLSPDAQKALQELYDGYAAQLRQETDRLKAQCFEELDRAELMNNDEMLEPVRERVKQFKARADAMKQQFLTDLKSLLTREQEANWPTMERELRRIRGIGRGHLCGESLDVVGLAEDVVRDGAMPAEVADVLLRYRAELDHALTARDDYLKDDGKDFMEACRTDPPRARKQWEEALKLRLAVRDINERYARQVAAQFPADRRMTFERAAFESSYPMFQRLTRLDAYLDDAQKLETLTPAQRAQLKEIQASRSEKVRDWARRAAGAWRQFEETAMPEPLAQALGQSTQRERAIMFNGSWLPENHPLIQVRLERVEIDKTFKTQTDAVLTPEQREGIPARLNEMAKFEVWTNHAI